MQSKQSNQLEECGSGWKESSSLTSETKVVINCSVSFSCIILLTFMGDSEP